MFGPSFRRKQPSVVAVALLGVRSSFCLTVIHPDRHRSEGLICDSLNQYRLGIMEQQLAQGYLMPTENEVVSNGSEDEATLPNETMVQEEQHEHAHRSVCDFDGPEDLFLALQSSTEKGSYRSPVEMGCTWVASMIDEHGPDGGIKHLEETIGQLFEENTTKLDIQNLDQALDWVLVNYDPETTHRQSMEEEMRRLLVLKSFLAFDIRRQEAFDRITAQAQEHMHCAINIIGLMDIGRQWLVSNVGLGDAKEVPRGVTFCAHTLQSTLDCLVVQDATKDPRFCDNPFVSGPPHVRFYAGVPLTSKEGYKIGTLCIADFVPRPDGLSLEDREILKGLAAETMKELELNRKTKMTWFRDLKKTCYPSLQPITTYCPVRGKDERNLDHSVSNSTEKQQDHAQDDSRIIIDIPKLVKEINGVSWRELLHIFQKQITEVGLPGMEVYLRKCADLTQPSSKRKWATMSNHGGKKLRFKPTTTTYAVESWIEMKEAWWSETDLYDFRTRARREVESFRQDESHLILCVEAMATEEDLSEIVDCLLHLTTLPYSFVRGLESHIVDLLSRQRSQVVRAVLDEQKKHRKIDADSRGVFLRQASEEKSEMSARFASRIAKCDEFVALKEYNAMLSAAQETSSSPSAASEEMINMN